MHQLLDAKIFKILHYLTMMEQKKHGHNIKSHLKIGLLIQPVKEYKD